jgi:hypothetical protein
VSRLRDSRDSWQVGGSSVGRAGTAASHGWSIVRVVGIHQPNFLPWLGFFDKIARSDCFILLDSVPLQLTGGNYTNRVKMMVNGAPDWITMPLRRGQEARARIEKAEIVEQSNWRRKVRRTIEQSYARAPYFELGMTIVNKVLDLQTSLLCEINVAGILAIADALALSTKDIRRASELNAKGQSNELLINLVSAVGGNTYLAGHGSGGYQDDKTFASRGIEVRYQDYQLLRYPQVGIDEFVPGLSAIDALMNCGHDAAKLITAKIGR